MTALTRAQRSRQLRRESNGQYEAVPSCYLCGRNASIDAYNSHPMTDTTDAEGQHFGDVALCICDPCAGGSADLSLVRQVVLFGEHRRSGLRPKAALAAALAGTPAAAPRPDLDEWAPSNRTPSSPPAPPKPPRINKARHHEQRILGAALFNAAEPYGPVVLTLDCGHDRKSSVHSTYDVGSWSNCLVCKKACTYCSPA